MSFSSSKLQVPGPLVSSGHPCPPPPAQRRPPFFWFPPVIFFFSGAAICTVLGQKDWISVVGGSNNVSSPQPEGGTYIDAIREIPLREDAPLFPAPSLHGDSGQRAYASFFASTGHRCTVNFLDPRNLARGLNTRMPGWRVGWLAGGL